MPTARRSTAHPCTTSPPPQTWVAPTSGTTAAAHLNDGHQGHVVVWFEVSLHHEVNVTSSQQPIRVAVTAIQRNAHTVTHSVERLGSMHDSRYREEMADISVGGIERACQAGMGVRTRSCTWWNGCNALVLHFTTTHPRKCRWCLPRCSLLVHNPSATLSRRRVNEDRHQGCFCGWVAGKA